MLERLDLIELIADTLVTKGSALGGVGRGREGTAVLLGGYELARSYRFVMPELRGAINLSAAASYESPRMGLEIAQAGLALARRLGLHAHMGAVLGNAAGLATTCGDWTWVVTATAEVAGSEPDPALRAFMETAEYEVLAMRGELAEEKVAELERLFADETEPNTRSSVAYNRVLLDLVQGRFGPASDTAFELARLDPFATDLFLIDSAAGALWARDAERVERAMAMVADRGSHGRFLNALMTTIAAGQAAIRGDRARAMAAYRAGFAEFDVLDVPFELARQVVISAWLLGADEPALAERVERARAILEELGAVVLLERLEQAPRLSTDRSDGSGASRDREALEGVG
jgi:hypothetical protein